MNKLGLFFLATLVFLFLGCSTKSRYYYSSDDHMDIKTYSPSPSAYSPFLNAKAYKHPTMNPYSIAGIRYYPQDVSVGNKFSGNASWYGPDFHGKLTSNGETYNMYDNTAAHKTLPMNTVVKVTNNKNGLTTIVRINDRGPFIDTRIIDLSNTAAKKIQMLEAGTAPVTIEVLGFYLKNKITTRKQPKKTASSTFKKSQNNKELRKYALQIASFTNIEGAIKIQEKFDGTDGYKTIIKDIEGENARFFKVYLKGFKTEEEVREYKSRNDFVNSFIVTY